MIWNDVKKYPARQRKMCRTFWINCPGSGQHRIPGGMDLACGNSTELFFDVLDRQDIWNLDIQKTFVDIRGLRR